jgi:hypothetical protein
MEKQKKIKIKLKKRKYSTAHYADGRTKQIPVIEIKPEHEIHVMSEEVD